MNLGASTLRGAKHISCVADPAVDFLALKWLATQRRRLEVSSFQVAIATHISAYGVPSFGWPCYRATGPVWCRSHG